MTKPILFLDIDGVLNNHHRMHTSKGTQFLCPIACGRLIEMVERVGVQIVLSSTWRKHPEDVEFLRCAGILDCAHEDWRTPHGLFNIIGSVGEEPIYSSAQRGDEIADWLKRHPEVETYAIVDDDSDFLPEQLPYFVQTSNKLGLLQHHVVMLEKLLSRNHKIVQPTPKQRAAAQ